MTARYFNLKKGNPDVHGGLIKIDTSAGELERLADFNGDFGTNPWTFNHLGVEGENLLYEVVMPNEEIVVGPARDSIGGRVSIPGPVPKGPAERLKLELTPQGDLRLHEQSEGFFLSEVSEKEAKKSYEQARAWAYQRAYVCE